MSHGALGLGMTLQDWYVTNGDRWVGPVDTGLLMRGVAAGKVSPECMVWRKAWSGWRSLSSVREFGVLTRARAARGPEWCPSEAWTPAPNHAAALAKAGTWIAAATDEREMVTMALQAVVEQTRSAAGLAHRPKGALGGLVTSAVSGSAMMSRLGAEVKPTDAAVRAARFGATVIERPGHSRQGVATMERMEALPDAVRGVALAPLYAGPRLLAVLELAKTDHAFRASDRAFLRAVMRAATTRIMRQGWARRGESAPS